MKKLFLILFLATCTMAAHAQNTTKEQDPVFNQVETQPQYPGGLKALWDFIKNNLQSGTEKGMVYTSFVIEKDGSVTNIKIIKSLSETADAEATRIIKKLQKWTPGMQGGKPVRTAYTMPVKFPMQ
jgi:protein TonB